MTKLLCTGDVHLGARRNHEREPGDGLGDQADVLDKIADLAIENSVDAVIDAGDTFEGPTLTPAEVVVFADFVAKLREHDIPVITTLGNGRHDLAMRDAHALRVLDHVPGVQTFDRPDYRIVGDTALCLLPWVHPGRLVAEADGGDRDEINADAAQLLLRAAADLKMQALASDLLGVSPHHVLVFHGSIEGAGLPNGIPIDTHASDILPIDDLAALGFDAVIASHIHVPQSWVPEWGWAKATDCPGVEGHLSGQPIFYTGSPLPLNFGEGGYEHGVWLLDLDHTGVSASFLPVESRGFVTVEVDLTAGAHDDLELDETVAVAAAIATHLPISDAIVRVRIRATEEQARRVDTAAVKTLLADTHKAYLAFDTVRGTRARVEAIDEDIAPLDAVDLYATANGLDEPVAAALREDTARYLDRLGVAS